MEVLFTFLPFALFLAFLVGMIKPSIVKMPSRGRACIVYFGGFWVMVFIAGSFLPAKESQQVAKTGTAVTSAESSKKTFSEGSKTLKDYRNEPKVIRREIVEDYVAFKDVPVSATDAFYACMSENTFTKDDSLEIGDVLGWCLNDYKSDPESLSKKINLDAFQGNFSGWDGSYRPLEKLIKGSMNDDSSFKHVSTTYHLILDKDPHAIVKTTFRGTNLYGAVVKQIVAARVDVRTGAVVSILDN